MDTIEYIRKKIGERRKSNERMSSEKFKKLEEDFFKEAHRHFYRTTPDMSREIFDFHRGLVSTTMERYVLFLQSQD